ncbi:DUF4440 domain-containing protein [Nocardioides sp. W7]|uniref:DUF4440 domain-containing protein n=1 Tax=Nocardioides sp. W7 TaxID=2931390 RepID=UPI001FD3DE97|nr:DUF4440 domain-containing protein [Nocardioides sp. W7]
MATGKVLEWHDDEGWGVLSSERTPGGCWMHYSALVEDGYRRLAAGEQVRFVWESVDQDDYSFRAEAVWPAGTEPFDERCPDPDPLVEEAPGWYAYVPDPADAARHGVLASAEQRSAALVSGDPDNLLHLLHPNFTWTTHRGDVLDRASYVRANTEGSLRWLEQRLDDPRVVIVGSTGVHTCVVHDRVVCDGVELTFAMPVTQIWVEEQDRWRCVAGHAGPAR